MSGACSTTGAFMIIDLSGKNAVVSGSTSGIGFAIAQGLAAAGAAVVLNGRSQKSVDTALSRLAATLPHAKVEGIAADLSVAEGVAALVARARETDILSQQSRHLRAQAVRRHHRR